MKRRTFALILACALSLSLLAACGSGGGSSSSGGSSAGGSSSLGDASSTPDGSADQSDQSAGGSASLPDESGSSSGSGSTGSSSGSQSGSGEDSGSQSAQLTMNRTDFTLFSAGSTFQLKASPAGGSLTWTSSDESVATVSDNGTVTAVAVGTATITAKDASTGLTATCIVRCDWEDEAPENGGSSSSGDTSTGGSSSSASVDLQAFFDTINADYEMPFMMEMDSAALDSYFPGLTGISAQQLVAYQCALSPSPAGDVVLVQLTNSSDVNTVKELFQDRIDYMTGADGGQPGAWYPGPTEMWQNSSRIVSNGNYVMLVVNENCDAIVNDFNALF